MSTTYLKSLHIHNDVTFKTDLNKKFSKQCTLETRDSSPKGWLRQKSIGYAVHIPNVNKYPIVAPRGVGVGVGIAPSEGWDSTGAMRCTLPPCVVFAIVRGAFGALRLFCYVYFAASSLITFCNSCYFFALIWCPEQLLKCAGTYVDIFFYSASLAIDSIIRGS